MAFVAGVVEMSRVLAAAPDKKEGGKPSKAPLYAEALRLYLSEPNPDLARIAETVGLRPVNVIDAAESQNWAKRRAIVMRDQSATRPIAAQAVDSQLVAATVQHVEKFTQEWQNLTVSVCALPVDPDAAISRDGDPQAWNKEHTRLLARKVDLMRQVSQGVREMTEAAMVLGLAKAPTAEKESGKGLDLSKLTQLNVTINAAMAKNAPELAEAIELPATAAADGGF